MPPTSCGAILKDYCSNCTFAGVRFIADDTKYVIERWFWAVLVVLSWYGSAVLIIAAWESFTSSPISFGLDTTYTKWNTKMPTVAICEMSNNKMIYNVSDTIWPPGHLLDLEDALKDIVYYRGSSYALLTLCYHSKTVHPLCPLSNFTYYANLVRSNCPQLVKNCSYNDKPFDCCEYFQNIDTELGTCYIINSIQARQPKPFPMVSNMTQKRGVLKFEVSVASTIYSLGEEDVPSMTTLQTSTLKVNLGYKYRNYYSCDFSRHMTVRNIVNDKLVVKTTPKQRACRFHYENENGIYPHYSYGACTVLCRKKAQLELCQCNDHFMLNTPEKDVCNITGLACLHYYASYLTSLKPRWASRPGLVCDCMPSCDETEITVIQDDSSKGTKKKATIEMILAYLPTERFKRNIVRSDLDLVVSIGGTTGLFVGASLLSFVEFLFYFTVRLVNNHLIKDSQQKQYQFSKLRKQKPLYENVDAAKKDEFMNNSHQHGHGTKNFRYYFFCAIIALTVLLFKAYIRVKGKIDR